MFLWSKSDSAVGGWAHECAVELRQGPRCSIRSRKLYSDAVPDYLKMTLLNLPAAVLVRARPSHSGRFMSLWPIV